MAKDKKKRAREPMLYIAQPDFQTAKPPMQSTYRSERKPVTPNADTEATTNTKGNRSEAETGKQEAKADTATKQKKERTLRTKELRNRLDQEFSIQAPQAAPPQEEEETNEWSSSPNEVASEQTEEREETAEEAAERRRVSFKNRKRRERFKDMTVEDKVMYFIELPSSVPRMRCEVITAEESYKGWVEDYENGVVYLKILQRPFRVEVPFADIQDIVLRGF